eukprot:PhM_4_TR6262/c1_g2_i1/m.83087
MSFRVIIPHSYMFATLENEALVVRMSTFPLLLEKHENCSGRDAYFGLRRQMIRFVSSTRLSDGNVQSKGPHSSEYVSCMSMDRPFVFISSFMAQCWNQHVKMKWFGQGRLHSIRATCLLLRWSSTTSAV